jgi:hypothetical protein
MDIMVAGKDHFTFFPEKSQAGRRIPGGLIVVIGWAESRNIPEANEFIEAPGRCLG